MNEFTLLRTDGINMWRQNDYKFSGIRICPAGLRRYISMPRGLEQIFLCFTKQAREQSFEIELRFTQSDRGRLVDHPKVDLLSGFTYELGKQFKLGHKFFHFEYN